MLEVAFAFQLYPAFNFLDKHGLDFADLNEAFFADALFVPSKKNRWKGIGADLRGVICVVFARLGSKGVSVISMRRASMRKSSECIYNLDAVLAL